MTDIPYQEARISLHANRIWSSDLLMLYNTSNASYIPLKNAVSELTLDFAAAFAATIYEDYPLEYNQNNMYNFTHYQYTNGTLSSSDALISYPMAIEFYLNSGSKMMDPVLLSQMIAINPILVQQESLFITDSGNHVMPSVAVHAV
jgi:hypothetical protein